MTNTLPPLSSLPPLANAIRALSMDAVEAAQSGHPGMPMGMADIAAVLFTRHLKFWPHNPTWPDRDRFILSGGHGSMLLYALSYLTGYAGMTIDDIKKFRQLGSRTPGHPEHDVDVGIEMTTGPLGQGIATSVGFALAEKIAAVQFGTDLVDHHTYVFAGDGDMQEGINHEACALAGHWNLNKLIVLYDDNGISIDGPTSLSFSEDVCARFAAYGFVTRRIDGHDVEAIDAALTWARTQDRPVLIACKTTIGKFGGVKAGTADCHGSPLGPDGIAAARAAMNWPHAPFVVPDDILSVWRAAGSRGRDAYSAWEDRLANTDDSTRQSFITAQAGLPPHNITTAINAAIAQMESEKPTIATRKASQMVLEHLVPALPNLIGGSADLTGSNLTKVKSHSEDCHPGRPPYSPPLYGGDIGGVIRGLHQNKNLHKVPALAPLDRDDTRAPYIHYGIREHGMGAIMNGLSLHGGFVPYGGTFLCFADYMRPAMRLAALMGTQAIYVMTHDSIGLGEDGPTHQPVEHLASLRAMPNMRVFRPADAIETAACWEMSLRHTSGPSVIALSRQNVPPLPSSTCHPGRPPYSPSLYGGDIGGEIRDLLQNQELMKIPDRPAGVRDDNSIYRGGYIVIDAPAPRVVICATGTEVDIAINTAKILTSTHGVAVRVISIPCFEIFAAQDTIYKNKIIKNCHPGRPPYSPPLYGGDIGGVIRDPLQNKDFMKIPDHASRVRDDTPLIVGIEAGVRQGWDQIIGSDGLFFGLNTFGASGKYKDVYEHFGLTPEYIAGEIIKKAK